jgi:hypothetical protein
MAGAGFHSIAKFRAQIRNAVMADHSNFQADCHKAIFHTTDCHSKVSEFESRMPLAWTARRVRIRPESGVGNPQNIGELTAKKLFLLWQTTALERGS